MGVRIGTKCDRRQLAVAMLRAAVAAVVIAGCRDEVAERPAPIRPVKMLTLGEGENGERREYPGTIEAIQHVDMAFEVAGRVVDFPVEEGQQVGKGQILAQLDPRDYRAKLESAAANVRKAEADLARSQRLYNEDAGAIALTQLDSDQRAVEVSRAHLKEAEKAFEDATLTAPFAGYVARKLVRDFANVQAKQPVLILQDMSALKIVVSVPERDFAATTGETREQLTQRTAPRVVVSALPQRSFPARLKELALTADPVTRTFAATFDFDAPQDAMVLPGMTAKISVRSADRAAGIRIPAQAARADAAGKAFVWTVDAKELTVHKRAVVLGPFSGSSVEVRDGLAVGDVIAVSGIEQLGEGMPVRRFESRGAERRE
jgi:RND family efflux transporter MFP subunit